MSTVAWPNLKISYNGHFKFIEGKQKKTIYWSNIHFPLGHPKIEIKWRENTSMTIIAASSKLVWNFLQLQAFLIKLRKPIITYSNLQKASVCNTEFSLVCMNVVQCSCAVKHIKSHLWHKIFFLSSLIPTWI